jgi:drug/metabolite transporter (DMT)-like permease
MIGWGVVRGERPSAFAWSGIVAALAGLVVLTWRGATAPDALGVAVMGLAGVAWAAYSLLGRTVVGEAMVATSMSFSRALPFTLVLAAVAFRNASSRPSTEGVLLAVGSGAVTSGLGYSAWYVALRSLSATQAAVLQLTVPVITALAALILLAETLTLRLLVASVAILGGVAVTIRETTRARTRRATGDAS